jgi:hypothetical protein
MMMEVKKFRNLINCLIKYIKFWVKVYKIILYSNKTRKIAIKQIKIKIKI